MGTPLLETKLYAPRVRRALVARPRLIEQLDRGVESKLALVSGPAGFGKSTVLAGWLAADPAGKWSPAWLSLDPADNHPPTFWSYLIAALQTAVPGLGARSLTLVRSSQAPITEALAPLINELAALSNDVVLVLDDYHVVDASEIQDGMTFLVEHLPRRAHVVIATRADPPLPLARLRAQGDLVEIRAADLRFTPDEAAAYLIGTMGLPLTSRDVAALEARTEGWIAALQLAALSMQGRDDVAGFIAGFSGDDRYIVDYLVEEVLRRQTDKVRTFLLDTSVLDRLCAPLCDAVTGQDDGRTMLAALERANLFLVPLDDHRRWYRYHHLFADVLRARLSDERPDRARELHLRASDWYEQDGERTEAIRHALAGEDFARAADLVELAIPMLRRGRQEATMRRWLDAIPDALIRARPVLTIGYVGALMVSGELEGVEGRLRDAERWLDASTGVGDGPDALVPAMVVVDEEQFRRLPGEIAIYRAAQARALGDAAGTVTYARRALDIVGADDHLARGAAAGFLGLVHWTSGDLDVAHQSWSDAVVSLGKAGHIADVLGCSIALADIRVAQGRLREAMRTYERAVDLATASGGPILRGMADMHVGMGDLFRERNDLVSARQHLQTGAELGEESALAQNRYRSRVVMARIREAEGDLDGALDLLDDAERLYVGDYFPNVRPIAALRARVWVALGRIGDALDWVRERGLSVDDDLTYLREFEHINLARVLLAASRRDGTERSSREGAELLSRLLLAAEAGERTGSVVEILVLQALDEQSRGDAPAALVSLGRALAVAEPEGYVRVFVDEGPPMSTLLALAAKHGIARTYARQLLTAFTRDGERTPVQLALVEPLSERELEVLRLLGSDLNGPDIARELVVSLHTVRSHTKSIFAKLGVNSRRAAVRLAADLDLLPRSRRR
jgi:LuxR family maltose regulon positive regulatory protein